MSDTEDDRAAKPAAAPPTDAARASEGAHPPAPDVPVALLARRKVLGRMSLTLGAAGGIALGGPMVGFVVGPLVKTPPREWRPLGKVGAFAIGETTAVTFDDASPLPWAGVTGRTAAWLRRTGPTEFVAFSINCAHLGCPVRWLAEARLFMCPCHGGVYYEDGSVAAGPPPHPLPQYPVRVNGGIVEIRTDPIPIG